jgi:hypothetical protein
VAGTIVVLENPAAAAPHAPQGPPLVPQAVGLDFSLLDLAQLTDDDWTVVQTYLRRAAELDEPTRARASAQVAWPLMQRLAVPAETVGRSFDGFLRGLADELSRRIDA